MSISVKPARTASRALIVSALLVVASAPSLAAGVSAVDSTAPEQAELRVQTSPGLPGQISVDGIPRDDWGLWTAIPTGSHQVCFGPVAGYEPPTCQTVSVTAGALTSITGKYTPDAAAQGASGLGILRVTTSPALPAQISVDGIPRDDWGLNGLELPPGSYTLSFSRVDGYTAPANQTVTVSAGQTTSVTGVYH